MADLSLSKQADIKLKAELIWADSKNQTEMYHADAETAKVLAEKQKDRTQIISQLEDPNLESDQVRVLWIDNCGDDGDFATQDFCDFSGDDAPLNSKTYQLTQKIGKSFSVDENDLLRNMYNLEEYVAKQLMTKMKAMDEEINRRSLLFLNASAGYNSNPEGYTFANDTLQIPAAEYNTELYLKMVVDAKYNLMNDAFVIDNGALYRDYLRADLERGNSDGDGAFQKKKLFNTSFDLVGFPSAPITDTSFLINPSAYAFANRNYCPDVPTDFNPTNGPQKRWTIASNNIPGVKYDVVYKYECSGRRFKHTWYLENNFDYILNPEGCDVLVSTGPDVFANRTGILSYTKS